MSGMDRLTDEALAVLEKWQSAMDDEILKGLQKATHADSVSTDRVVLEVTYADVQTFLDHRRASQSAPAHEDELAVDRFAAVMKTKLAKKRNDGRGGWSGPECSEETLSRMLRDHVGKGDPVDVANFAMMLHQRGERIAQAAPAPSDGLREENVRLRAAVLRDAKRRMADLTEWLNEDDANPILLRHAVDAADLEFLRAALSSPAQEGGE